MLSITIPNIVRENSVNLSPVSSLVKMFHENPKEYFKTIHSKKTNNESKA